ncbi:MAG: phosphoadenylyl-sulfate reductase [Planctomycetota bacterium]
MTLKSPTTGDRTAEGHLRNGKTSVSNDHDEIDQVSTLSAEDLVRWAVDRYGDRIAMTTSFGIQAAVMLHMVTRIKPDISVIWVDTGYLHTETYCYVKQLSKMLDLNLLTFQSNMSPAHMEAVEGKLWESEELSDLNRYDSIRKVEPLKRALQELNVEAWLTGLRRDQTDHRVTLPRLEPKAGRVKVYPLLNWSSKDVYEYRVAHGLPHHPLFAKGYQTVGDWHSSRAMTDDDSHERDTRFGGLKQECGIHLSGDGEGI